MRQHRTKLRHSLRPDWRRGSRHNRERRGRHHAGRGVHAVCGRSDGRAFDRRGDALHGAQRGATGGRCRGAGGGARAGQLGNDFVFQASAVGANAVPLAIAVATQVAANNPVGGRNLIPGGTCPGQEICVDINQAALDFVANPQVTVKVQRTDLPTFFARIWGRTAVHRQSVGDRRSLQSFQSSGNTGWPRPTDSTDVREAVAAAEHQPDSRCCQYQISIPPLELSAIQACWVGGQNVRHGGTRLSSNCTPARRRLRAEPCGSIILAPLMPPAAFRPPVRRRATAALGSAVTS